MWKSGAKAHTRHLYNQFSVAVQNKICGASGKSLLVTVTRGVEKPERMKDRLHEGRQKKTSDNQIEK